MSSSTPPSVPLASPQPAKKDWPHAPSHRLSMNGTFNSWSPLAPTSRLTYEKSYLARLHYVHANPVKHKLVRFSTKYPWCSAAWFERTATPAMVRTIYSFKIDELKMVDDF